MDQEKNFSQQLSAPQNNDYEPIAIVGMGCRLPGGANDPYQFWENIKNGVNCLESTPFSRWSREAHCSQTKNKKGKVNAQWGGYIDGFDEFDPLFFGISPREAEHIDPQQRKLLQVAWETIEDAGIKPSHLSKQSVGVFVGGFTVDYKILQFTNPDFKNITSHTATGVMMTMLSNRLSYIFDLNGPSLSIDTACSSSLVAIDMACRSIQQGDSNLAIAGGVLLTFAPQYTVSETQGGFLSPTGNSHAFADTANGYVRSEGVGLVLLKPLRQAEADGDAIHAVIIGSAVNQDGRTNGITVPNSDAQLALMQKAYQRANVAPNKVQYIEMHGTGTPVGDPIEARSVGRLVTPNRAPEDQCYIGSVKTNIGHTESAAGTAALIKTVLALKHQQIPPHLHFHSPNPAIAFDQYAYQIPTSLTPWPTHEGAAIAGVNSFGFGGTNAHVVLQQYQTEQTTPALSDDGLNRPHVLPISHADEEMLPQQVQAYYDQISVLDNETALYHLSYSSALHREQHSHQIAFVYENKAQLLAQMEAYLQQQTSEGVYLEQRQAEEALQLVWVLTGMGPQWWAMGHELYRTEPVYRDTIDQVDAEFSRWVDWSLKDEMFASEDQSKMAETWLAQTANFALQVALAALWRSYGIQPAAIVGHSTGEAAAFYLAGVYSLADAVKIIVHRSRLQHLTRGLGKMLAVGISETDVAPYLAPYRDKVSIGAVNSPVSLTLTGDAEALERIAEALQAKEIFNKFLRVEVPYHSVVMEKIKDDLLHELAAIQPHTAQVPLYSTVTGQRVDGSELDAQYWWNNVREPVYFAKAITNLMQQGHQYFLEVGPHPVLSVSLGEVAESLKQPLHKFYSIRRKYPEQTDFYAAVARLQAVGFALDWRTMYPHGQFMRLPRYQWRKDRYWYETPFYQRLRQGTRIHPLLGNRSTQQHDLWLGDASLDRYAYLHDHVIQDSCLLPAAGYIEMVYGALLCQWGTDNYSIDELKIDKGVFLSADQDPELELHINSNTAHFKIVSTSTSITSDAQEQVTVQEDRHISGFIRRRPSADLGQPLDLEFERHNSFKAIDKSLCYAQLEKYSYQYGPCFQAIETLWLGSNSILAKIVLPDLEQLDSSDYHLHPSLLDACLQTIIFHEIDRLTEDEQLVVRLPVSVKQISLNANIPDSFWCVTRIVHRDDEKIVGDLSLCTDDGSIVGVLKGFIAQAVDTVASGMNLHTIDTWLYDTDWVAQESQEFNNLPDQYAYLLFADLGGVAQALAEQLRTQGHQVCLVISGYMYSHNADFTEITLEPDSLEHLRQCLTAFYERHGKQSRLLHCIGLDHTPNADQLHNKELETLKEVRLHSLLFIAKVMLELEMGSQLWLVTRNAHNIDRQQANQLNLISASLSGISRVLAQHELSDNWGRHIDFAHDDNNVVAQLLAELSLDCAEEEIHYHHQQRYVSRLTPATELNAPFPVRLQANACYLVAGGFGAIGRLVCRWLIHKGARRLLLITRTPFPNRDSWKLLDSEHRLYERIQFINEIEALGAEVILADVDVSHETDLRHYFNHFEQQGYPPIRGVFFCSGVVKDTLISNLDRDDFNAVYDTKAVGALVLHQCLAHLPLDYFVLFSSIAGLVTTAGQANYAAGNRFLDALAHYRRAQGLPALSINWGPWAIGMIKELGLGDHYKNQRGMPPILPEAGIKVLERIIELDQPQLAVCDAHWNKVLEWYSSKPALFRDLADAEAVEEQADDFLSRYNSYPLEQRAALVEEEFKILVGHILRTDSSKITATDSVVALGIDSIMGVELNNRMLAHFGERLSVVKLLGSENIAALAAELNDKIAVLAAERANNPNPATTEETPEIIDTLPAHFNPFAGLDIEDEYPLSYGQKAIWFTHKLNPLSAAYNIGGVMHIPATLDLNILNLAINGVIKRHAGLRANFYVVEGEPVQRIYAERPYELSVVEVHGQDWESIRAMAIADNQLPFDLENEPLFRIRLYRQAEDSYYFAITIYHIISDAWSNYMFLNEMQGLYAQYLKADSPDDVSIAPTRYTYRHFVESENRLINSIRGSAQYKFWRNRLPADIPQLALPTDKKRPVVQTNNGASYNFIVDAALTAQLQQLAKSEGATMFVVMFSLYFVLMHKYSQQNDIIIGSPVAGRNQADFADIYGYFVNPLPIWARFDGEPHFIDFLQQVRETMLLALEHQEFPFSLLVDRLEMEHDPSRSAIFQVMFVLLSHQVERSHIDENNVAHYEGFPMRLLQMPEEEGQFDLTLTMYEEKGVYYGTFKYNTDLFIEDTIARMAQHFITLAQQAIAQPRQPVSQYRLVTATEQHILLNQWSGQDSLQLPAADAPLLAPQIQTWAMQTPQHPAVQMRMDDGQQHVLTYAELDSQANQLGHYLLANQVNAGDVVGLYMDKSPQLMVALLACLKIGAAYLILDRELPQERLQHMLNSSAARCLIQATAADDTNTFNLPAHILADCGWQQASDTVPSVNVQPEHIAYIVFTSGSTGVPKGVQVTHGNLLSIATAWRTAYQLEHTHVHLQMAHTSFDVFSGDWVRALSNGKTLQLCPRSTLLNMPLLFETIVASQVDFAEFVPTVLRKLVAYLRANDQKLDMHSIIVASERWTVNDYQQLRYVTAARIFNSYGTSEATIDSTYCLVNSESLGAHYDVTSGIPIGKPFNNSLVFVLDKALNPVPAGVTGELYISGVGVSQGYVNDAAQTQQVFVQLTLDGQTQLAYKTGDSAHWDADGYLHFDGRQDNQVKIRGHRIELSEVEKALLNDNRLRQAVVIIQTDALQESCLCAYYELHEGETVESDAIRYTLAERLPSYMLPSFFHAMDKLPELENGKINLNALPKPQRVSSTAFHAPETMYETKLAEIWRNMLGASNVGVYDDFFELGGNSLYLIELLVQIQAAFNIQLSVNQLFKLSTLRGMAKTVEDVVTGKIEGAQPYITYNAPSNGGTVRYLFSFPPAGGYSIVYQALAEAMSSIALVSFNYLTAADKLQQYVKLITDLQPQGPYALFGYSLGGNLAFEVARELEKSGHQVAQVFIMDSYRVIDDVTISEQILDDFREELRGHFKKHTGSDAVQEHTMLQANNYIDFTYQQKNLHPVEADVHFIIEANDEDPHRANKLTSWDGSSTKQAHLHYGVSRHEDMLLGEHALAHAKLIGDILA